MSLSFFGISLFFIYKNLYYSILFIGLVIFLSSVLVKEKMNYKKFFLKKSRKKKRKACAGRAELCKLVVMQLNRVARIKNRGCFRVLKDY